MYREGIIAIDLYDAKSRQPMWHASVDQSLEGADGGEAAKRINAAVAALFTKYSRLSLRMIPCPAGRGGARSGPWKTRSALASSSSTCCATSSGLPLPAVPTLVVAGAMAADGQLPAGAVFALAVLRLPDRRQRLVRAPGGSSAAAS